MTRMRKPPHPGAFIRTEIVAPRAVGDGRRGRTRGVSRPTLSSLAGVWQRGRAMPADSPWLTVVEASAYLHLGRRFIRKEILAGRLRGAVVGGRREVLTRREWCDVWVDDHTTPVVMPTRRLAR